MVEWQRVRFAIFAATVLFARTSGAQGRNSGPPPPVTKTAPHEMSSAEAAEDRARAGDCAGALDAFDAALRKFVAPELHRDRGLCHEKLGHPFPAIEDYRAYLEARPNAADADGIRARLEALEAQTAGARPVDKGKGTGVTMSIGGDSGTGGSLDALERSEQLDAQADGSALRRGHGFVFGLAFDAKHYGSSSFGWAEGGALDLRYSLSAVSTILVEIEMTHVNGQGSGASLSGPGFFGGYEARVPLNKRVDDALLLGGTFGYENLSLSQVGLVFNVLEPQARLGYRHVIGPSFGLEATVDAGAAFVHLTGAPAGVSASTSTSLVGMHLGVVLGF